MNNKQICKVPFTSIEIGISGDVTVCCPAKNTVALGNIYVTPFDKIWYSDIAIRLRNEIKEGNYKSCDLKICNPLDNIEQDKLELMEDKNFSLDEKPPYPKYVKFCHDNHCNIKCITCRDCFITNTKDRTEELDKNIETTFLPILKNCEVVSMNGSGEVFASQHCKNLIKAIVKTYPNIKFDLHTNGLLCTKKLCDELGITDKLVSIDISMHAAKKKTYEKIMQASNYDKVIENLKWLSELKKSGLLKRLDLYYVVQKLNYKEMKDFVKFGTELGANIYFWEYRNWGTSLNYDKYAVFEKWHKEYNKLAKILEDPIFKQQNVFLNNYLKCIKPISFSEKLKSKIEKNNYIFRKIRILLDCIG